MRTNLKKGSRSIGPGRCREFIRRIPGAPFLFLIFVILVGLLALSVGMERTQAQGSSKTLPSVKVAFIGDAGTSGNARAVLQLIKNQGADFVLHQGDFAYGDEDAAAARTWNDQVNSVLGADYPYFGAVGNHDDSAWPTYQEIFQDWLNRNPDAKCQGDYGVNSACHYRGIFFILSGVGTRGSGHVQFIENQLASDSSTWRICSWHKTQRALQVGGKANEAGWGAYEACRKGGAIIATAHEHSYSRTRTLTSMPTQTVDPDRPAPNELRVSPGSTFAFVSGLGGHDIRDQERCLPTSYPYGCNGEWASIQTSDQGAKPGALFIEFNFGGDPNRARGRFIYVNGRIVDEFMITREGNSTAPGARLEVSNLTAASGKNYLVTDSLAAGDQVYIDRSYTFETVPPPILGATLVRTANNDKHRTESSFLKFTVNQSVEVYVAYDSRATSLPIWLRDWADTGQILGTTDTPRRLYSRSFSPGVIVLGANSGEGSAGASSNYSVAILRQEKGSPANHPPVAANQSLTVAEGKSIDITLTGSDVDGDGLAFTVLARPAHGSLSGTAPSLKYSPDPNFTGTDSFTFKVDDGLLDSNVATVMVSVTARLVVSNMTAASGKTYRIADGLAEGGLVYIDRGYTFRTVPLAILGSTLVRTANDDKYRTDSSFLRFTVNHSVMLYVAYDSRATSLPIWLRDWADSGQILETTDTQRRLYSKAFGRGVITLGANSAKGSAGSSSNYSLAVLLQDGG